MSTENIKVTPESIQEAYKTLGISFEKSQKTVIEKAEDENSDEDEMEDEKEKKGKKKKEGMEKSEEDKFQTAFDKLSKGLDKKFEAMATINKGLTDELSETREELSKAQERLEEIETSSAGRKSITTQNYIEKAFQENETNGKKMLSVSQHKQQIQKLLIEKAGIDGDVIEKGQTDEFWMNEMQYFEATGAFHPRAIEKLYKDDNIQLVK